ncbi:hypothetical protein ABZ826_14040 [Streptomyces sp. NPDC047515]|uniref:hypothetical protein n=1 Tax=Streptomyces sp. NPDC047515 TaxID=3155380 RepID=UPI0033DFE889
MHTVLRTGGVIIAGIVTAVALTGCGSGSEKSDPGGGSDAGKAGPASGGGGAGADAAALEGGWAGKTDGKAVILSVASGKAVLVTEQQACTGTVKETGRVTLALKCADGDTARTTGSVVSIDGKTVKVSWDGGTEDTLAKTEPGAIPSGLPGLPTP